MENLLQTTHRYCNVLSFLLSNFNCFRMVNLQILNRYCNDLNEKFVNYSCFVSSGWFFSYKMICHHLVGRQLVKCLQVNKGHQNVFLAFWHFERDK